MATPFTASYNGLALGVGTPYPLETLSGWDDLANVRKVDIQRAGAHGAFAGIDLLAERIIMLSFIIVGASQSDYDNQVVTVASAFAPQLIDLPLVVTLGNGVPRQILCRPSKRSIPRESRRWGMSGVATIELIAVDPRLYDVNLQSSNVALAVASGGTRFPISFPLTFGTTGSGGTLTLTNSGNTGSSPVFTINGPVVNPIIDNTTTGVSLSFNITLGVTDTLTVDAQAKTVQLNRTANRYSAMAQGSTWFDLPPGSSTIRYRNNGASSISTMTVQFRSAWL